MNKGIGTSELSDVIGAIYDCALDPTAWPETLDMIRSRLGFANGALALQTLPSGDNLLIITTGIEERWLKRFSEYGRDSIDIWGGEESIQHLPFDRPAVLSRVNPGVTGPDSTNRYYREWAQPQGLTDLMVIRLTNDPASIGSVAFGLHGGLGNICDYQIELAQLLTPHLQRAVTISRLLDVRSVVLATFEAVLDIMAVPVVLTGADLSIVHANEAARALLTEGDFIRSQNHKLATCSTGVTAALAVAVAQANDDESAIGRKGYGIPANASDGAARSLHVMPLRYGTLRPNLTPGAVAAIFIATAAQPNTASTDVLADLFGLTPTEMIVFRAIAAGRTRTEISDLLNIEISTVKTHLIHLFDKTGVRRQADLVTLFASFSLPV